MNRRRFLAGLAFATAALLGSGWLLRRGRTGLEARLLGIVDVEIRRILRARLDYLIVADRDLAAFAADERQRTLRGIRRRARPARRPARWLHEASRRALPALAEADVRRACAEQALEDRLVVTFLASSSFFYQDADESVPVTYRHLDAIYGTCRNPFARFV